MNEVQPFSRQHNVILVLLLALATAAWAVVVWQGHDVSMNMTMASPTAWGLHALLFLAMWVVMMVAMMLPTAAPMILAFHSVHARNHQPDGKDRASTCGSTPEDSKDRNHGTRLA